MKSVLLLIVSVFCYQANAKFMAEPFVGYETSSESSTSATTGLASSSTATGTAYGARLGYHFEKGYWLAAEFSAGSGKDKASSSESNYSKQAMSAVFGYDFGRFNVFAGYGISDKITYKGSTPPDTYTSGTNMSLGIGTEFMNHVAVNLDYTIPNYTKFGNGTTEQSISSAFSKYSVATTMLSISFPFGKSK